MATKETWAGLSALAGGAAWGAFWVPVRALEQAGFAGFWSVATLWGGVSLLALPLFLRRIPSLRKSGQRAQLAGFLLGITITLYSIAFLYTEVAPAVLLYYLSPVWGFLLGWVILGDPITPVRWLAMVLALTGAAVLMGGDSWPPVPKNAGDWMALAAGVTFVGASLLMLTRNDIPASDYIVSTLTWTGLIALTAALAVPGELPDLAAFIGVAPWLLAAVVLLAMPGTSAAIYGATILNPGIVGILFMTEIGISLALAAILTDEPFGFNQALGCGLIVSACMAEGVWSLMRRH